MKTISLKKLIKLNACTEALSYATSKGVKSMSLKKAIDMLVQDNHVDYATWLLPRLMTDTQRREYALYCAESVLEIYEAKYPDDNRVRLCIAATRAYFADPSEANLAAMEEAKSGAWDAAYCAADAAYAAYAASAAYVSYYAARAADAADAASHAAYAAHAAHAASHAARAADAADAAGRKEIVINILKKGMEIVGKGR